MREEGSQALVGGGSFLVLLLQEIRIEYIENIGNKKMSPEATHCKNKER